MILDSCGDSCGWVAALIALIAFGTYGVPIKHTQKVDVNPLIFQTYKTVTMLLYAPAVVTALGVDATRLTPWGLLSGLLWVLGGTGGVVAVRWAGMATAISTWASVMIMINFVWGILIFREPVANLANTTAAFVLLVVGLIGMSHAAAPPSSLEQLSQDYEQHIGENGSQHASDKGKNEQFKALIDGTSDDLHRPTLNRRTLSDSSTSELSHISETKRDDEPPPLSFNTETHILLFGTVVLSKRQAGVLAAVFNGLMAGSSLIPLHYAKRHGFGGAHYMMSYAVGAFIANLVLWLIYFVVLMVHLAIYQSTQWGDVAFHAAADMPSPHLQQLWKPGLCAGMLLATAMFGSILSVTYLGQGVGNSVIQAKIIVSGMWGIFYYKEIKARRQIRNWFLFASLSVAGIIWLSRERIAATDQHRFLVLEDF